MLVTGCAKKGLIEEQYDEAEYRVPNLLPEDLAFDNGTILVYSDNQAGWLVEQKFLNKSSWWNWRMVFFPVYVPYLVGAGIVGGIDYALKIPDYGGKERKMVRDAIYAEAKASDAYFILNLGDINAFDGRRPAHWRLFLRENMIEHPLVKEVPYLTVLGNHEHANDTIYGFPNYQAVFGHPRFYAVEFTDAAIFVIDYNFIVDQYQYIDDDVQDELFEEWFVSDPESGKRSWLEQQLASSDKTFKIIAIHLSPLTCGKHYTDWFNPDNGRNLPEKRFKLIRLFEKYDIQLVLSGHDHFYQHKVLASEGGGEMHYLIAGGGGTPLRDPYDEEFKSRIRDVFLEAGFNVDPVCEGKIFHYLIMTVMHDELTIKVMEVTGEEEEPIKLFEEIVIESRSSGE